MANYNILFSPTGGTRRVADLLAKSMGGEFREIDLCCAVEKCELSAVK